MIDFFPPNNCGARHESKSHGLCYQLGGGGGGGAIVGNGGMKLAPLYPGYGALGNGAFHC